MQYVYKVYFVFVWCVGVVVAGDAFIRLLLRALERRQAPISEVFQRRAQ